MSIIYNYKAIAARLPNGRRFGSADDETAEVGEAEQGVPVVVTMVGYDEAFIKPGGFTLIGWECEEHNYSGWSADNSGCPLCAIKDQE